ncbi:protein BRASSINOSTEROID INSENSITIVE 1-like protein [Cinnamomum micranthum f. kanehirae]|uniref:Protein BRASSINOSTEROID INSENSITIVE 1-like protein n=1 Tax=Cinnamomum micranthum f. kanehirae TaxID=337451 RepID=A0A3S3NK90_9MAGN|nr:protein BRASSINOSTEROID INSENSITIVE 1-like protein [Cinnamomum micranthum f. kanehirae]
MVMNLICGKIPSSLNFGFEAVVDFSSNRLVGPLPQNLSVIFSLDLANNFLSGPIDMSFEYIWILFLSNNSLHGSIPTWICNLIYIEILDLSRNNLTGQVPSCFEDFRNLFVLDLSYNNLDGLIPNTFSYNLRWLKLSHNNLSGVLPSLIGVQSSLLALDLSRNRLSGYIPRWLGESTSDLVILNLRSNMFHGNIPLQLSLLSSLQILDLANNSQSGEVPTSFANFTSMAMTGKLNYSIFPEIYIGGAFKIMFQESITNHLSGKIPSSISSLTFLSKLNLSNNNLSGTIPSGNQLQTLLDPSIYAGNYDLCGPFLPKLCSAEVVPQPPNTFRGEDEDDGTEHWWFFWGFIAGFWLACGILIFSKTWRIAYFRFFDRLNERLDGFYLKMVAMCFNHFSNGDKTSSEENLKLAGDTSDQEYIPGEDFEGSIPSPQSFKLCCVEDQVLGLNSSCFLEGDFAQGFSRK